MAAGTGNPATVAQDLQGRVAVVTGGSSGIGAACVRTLAARGATVVIGYNRGRQRAEALCDSLPGDGHRCAHIPLARDDASDVALATLAEELTKANGRVDVLVNSAGFTQRIAHADIETLTPALFDRTLSANAGGTYAVIRTLMPLLRESGDAVVVNISSVSAFTGLGSNVAYCAAKAALDTMTQSLARAFGHGIRFLTVSPASVDTDFVAGRNRDELLAKAEKTPLGRVVTPNDVASAVIACVTQLRTATGTRIVIDGGHTL
ncbi:short-chain dehydrogenase [Pandoraea cepalis]|uniref:Short-chain dehydrogenase n=2 Tax=Pandoraea cepalis TaxID=2508294 RepID=A0AAW7MHZ6_9BURK|nr:short-chain dehydrogenase [Pandoraea cepalis]MDN4576883.1 short-chain dehydrogenase [Pandoraea cepalis]